MESKSNSENEILTAKAAGQAGCAESSPVGSGGVVPVLSLDRIWKVAITSVLFVLLFRQELVRLMKSWGTASESHGMLIPAFSLYFIYQQRERLSRVVGKSSYCGLLLMFLSLLGYLYSVYAKFGYPKPIMMITMICGIVLFLGGWKIFRLVWLPILFLVFAIKLPGGLHEAITIPMRELASAVASVILNLFPDVQCEASGVLIFGSRAGVRFDLNVAEACSGMRLLRAFVALGVAMAYLEYRPMAHRLILLFSTVPIAIFCNMLRVLLTGMVHIFIGAEYASGTLHTIMGLLMLGVAFGLYGLLAWFMNNLYVDDNEADDVLLVKS